ncbi:MAG: hypothetical protein LC437_03400 [Thiohalomonas sp.]|nr:hypothetical protein [Thiohalomonas sp.]
MITTTVTSITTNKTADSINSLISISADQLEKIVLAIENTSEISVSSLPPLNISLSSSTGLSTKGV